MAELKSPLPPPLATTALVANLQLKTGHKQLELQELLESKVFWAVRRKNGIGYTYLKQFSWLQWRMVTCGGHL